jgi:hypothetical protein
VLKSQQLNLRDILTSSKIIQILKTCGVQITIIQLKQLLKELGFVFNGPSTSLISLLQATRSFTKGPSAAGTSGEDGLSDMSNLTQNKVAPKV